MHRFFIVTLLLASTLIQAQNVRQLWQRKDYEGLYEMRGRVDRMSGDHMLKVARAAHELGEDSTAIYILNLNITKGYADDQVYYWKGACLMERKLYVPAGEAFHMALALNKNRLPYMLAKADAYYKAEMPDSALAVYTRLHRLFPDKDIPTSMMCQIPMEEGYIEEAIRCWKANIPDLIADDYKEEAYEKLARLQWQGAGDTTGAEESLNRLVTLRPDRIKNRLLFMQFLAEQERWSDFDTHLSHVMDVNERGLMPRSYIRRNALPIIDLNLGNYRAQVFQTLVLPDTTVQQWKVFFVTPVHGQPVAKLSVSQTPTGFQAVLENREGSENLPIEGSVGIPELVAFIRSIESKL